MNNKEQCFSNKINIFSYYFNIKINRNSSQEAKGGYIDEHDTITGRLTVYRHGKQVDFTAKACL